VVVVVSASSVLGKRLEGFIGVICVETEAVLAIYLLSEGWGVER